MSNQVRNTCQARRGAAMVTTLMVVGVLGTLSLAMLGGANSSFMLNRAVKNEAGAMYVAEAGLSEAIDELTKDGDGALGANGARVEYGTGSYWVESQDLGQGVISLLSTAVQGRSAARVELVIDTSEDSFFQWGAFGDAGVTMDSNAHVDSYHSGDAPYDPANGKGSDKYDSSNGTVGSNADIQMDSNTMVFGNAVPGPSGTVVLSGKARVTGTTVPNTETVDLPAIEMPSIPSSGDWFPSGNVPLASGDHGYDTFQLDGNSTLTITGPARIVCNDMYVDSNSQILIDGTNGPVEFFVRDDFIMNSNTLIASTTEIPAHVRFNLETNNIIDPDADIDLDEVDFDSNAKLYGTVYAPNAHVAINSNFELFGSLVARSVELDSNSYVHFDEALLETAQDSEESAFTRILWRERPVRLSEIEW